MTKAELEKEAEDKSIKYADSLEYTIPKFSDEEGYCWSQVEEAYYKGALDFAEPREKRIAELKKACDETQELLNKQIEATYKVVEELNKAKELLNEFSEFVKNEVEYDPEHPQEHTDLWNELCEKTEQFLKEE